MFADRDGKDVPRLSHPKQTAAGQTYLPSERHIQSAAHNPLTLLLSLSQRHTGRALELPHLFLTPSQMLLSKLECGLAHSRTGHFEEQKYLLPLAGIKARIFKPAACCPLGMAHVHLSRMRGTGNCCSELDSFNYQLMHCI